MNRNIIGYLVFSLLSVLITGFFTLESLVASSFTITITLLFFSFAGNYISTKNKSLAKKQLFLFWGGGLLFYMVLSIINLPKLFFLMPPLYCLVCFFIGIFFSPFNYKTFVIVLLFSVIYAYHWYPSKVIFKSYSNYKDTILYLDEEQLVDEFGINQMENIKDKVVLLEFWNEYCGSCFHAMEDLHPFLQNMKKEHPNFSYYYIYSNSKIPKNFRNTVFFNKKFPKEIMPVLVDENQALINKFNTSIPLFILISVQDKTGKIEFLTAGYNANFSIAIKQLLKRKIHEAL